MPKRSNAFSCKLNKNYKDALKFKKTKKASDAEICRYYQIPNINFNNIDWRNEYKGDHDNDVDGYNSYHESQVACCGIDELEFHGIIDQIKKNTPETKYLVAGYIQTYYNNDRRIIFTGLPLKSSDGHNSQYTFKNYRVLQKILLDFGFKQVHPRLYKNTNSRNMLSVLVGQFP